MGSFEELKLKPELVEALAAEGIEVPTALQAHAIPTLRRGNSAVLRGGPGAGLLVAYGIPLLDRLDPRGGEPTALVLTPTRERAGGLAVSLSRLALATGHRVGALGIPWALPDHADILFATPGDLAAAVRNARVKVGRAGTVVLEGAGALLEGAEAGAVETVLDALEGDGLQLVVVADPVTEGVRAFVRSRSRRAVFLPPEAAAGEAAGSPVRRGTLRVRTVEGGTEEEALALTADLLEEGAPHVLLFLRSEDGAADMGDYLGLHGYVAGRPGDGAAPVWLGTDPLEAREALKEGDAGEGTVAVVSVDVPGDEDELDRRHGGPAGSGHVLAHPRELPHLRRTASGAGYALDFLPPRRPAREEEAAAFRATVDAAAEEEDLTPYLLLLEPLFRTRGAAEVAAALALLLRRREAARHEEGAAAGEGDRTGAQAPGERAPAAWVRLFISAGRRDGVGPGDLLGAITGETRASGDQVGRIEIRDNFSRVEVQESVAREVVRALNGTTLRSRSIRVDYDRGDPKGRTRK